MSRASLTRRRALLGAAALALEGCAPGARTGAGGPWGGSTVRATWRDRTGDGQLTRAPGEPLRARSELGAPAPAERTLVRLVHLTDAHVMDAASPARVPFLDRLGPPLQSTFRPQEALTARVLSGMLATIRGWGPDAVIEGGDLIDNAQANELSAALALLAGGTVRPGSGPEGYFGVQSAVDPDPFYYRPELDAPRHPGLLPAAMRRFRAAGASAPWYPVLGDHDVLVQGELTPTALTRSLALGRRALWDLPRGLSLPPGLTLASDGSPDGPLDPGLVGGLLERALSGPTVRVPADPRRRELTAGEAVATLSARSALRGAGAAGARLDYAVDLGSSVRLIVLDLARRDGGSGGLVTPGQPGWLAARLAQAGERWAIVVSHQPLESSQGGQALLSLLDGHPRVAAVLAGHIHRNSVIPRSAPAGGYWQITTASLIDYPQQARALELVGTRGGGVALRTWMLDHADPSGIGPISRELSYLDAQGGRPMRFSGGRLDRNLVLYRRAPG
jgi:hypothetical protein